MIPNLTYSQLSAILQTVFAPQPGERDLTFLVDLPDEHLPDTSDWVDRRRIAVEWFSMVRSHIEQWPFRALNFATYRNVGSNNASLPDTVEIAASASVTHDTLPLRDATLGEVLERTSVVIALTQLSATAPLKVLSRTYPFRGATLPNFLRVMIPALGLDYQNVDARVRQLQTRMDRAEGAEVHFNANGVMYPIFLDLRYRAGIASGGLIRSLGTVGNLPSGEAYIVPYEGEREGEPSTTAGVLPIEFGDEIVLFMVDGNRCVDVMSSGQKSDEQKKKLTDEPAYGNLAELGIGVLGEWGITAVGSTLLDEKLGLHIAFGRSDHFGGATGPEAFNDPANVTHIDWVYVPSVQPNVRVESLAFRYADGSKETIMRDNAIVI
jgi:hypothetical protein